MNQAQRQKVNREQLKVELLTIKLPKPKKITLKDDRKTKNQKAQNPV